MASRSRRISPAGFAEMRETAKNQPVRKSTTPPITAAIEHAAADPHAARGAHRARGGDDAERAGGPRIEGREAIGRPGTRHVGGQVLDRFAEQRGGEDREGQDDVADEPGHLLARLGEDGEHADAVPEQHASA